MVTQKLHTKEESDDAGISIPQTPQRQQQTSPIFDTAKALQTCCLQPSILTLNFHLPPPDGRYNPDHRTNPGRNDTYISLPFPYQIY